MATGSGASLIGFMLQVPSSLANYGLYAQESSITIKSNTFAAGYGGVYVEGGSPTSLCPSITDNVFQTSSYGVYQWCQGKMTIDSNVFKSGFAVDNAAGSPTVSNNTFQNGMILLQHGSPLIAGNTFTSGSLVLRCQFDSSPKVRGNDFSALGTNVAVKVTANATPDLGTAADPGNNKMGSSVIDAAWTVPHIVSAVGNNWTPSPPVCGVQILVSPANSKVVWGASGEACP